MKTNNALWLCDGTFKVSPIQLYTIHIQIGGFYPPCIYALLSNKRESSYRKLLVGLNQLTGGVWPEKILLDFEKVAINIFSEQYPASEIKGCFFHFCQSFNRKICKLGLKKIYENNPELTLTLRMIPALSFVPEPMVSASFDLVIEEKQDVCEIAKLDTEYLQMIDDLASYFQRTYI